MRLKKTVFSLIRKVYPPELVCKEFIAYDSIDKSARKSEDLEKTLRTGCKVLEELGVEYWISRGTLLGFHRDGDFLPGDVDIDIDVYTDRDIYRIIQRLPFDVLLVNSHNGRYMQFAFLDRETNVMFDLWFFYDKDERLFNRHSWGQFWLPSEQINNLGSITYNGVEYPAPDPDWFCRYWYGEDWRLPKSYGKDWTIDYRKDCEGFTYGVAKNRSNIRYVDE